MITITDDMLIKASDNLYYEAWMLRSIAAIFRKPPIDNTYKIANNTHTSIITTNIKSTGVVKSSILNEQNNTIVNNALIESFAIHARVLLDFFYKTAIKDDVVAEHYFTTRDKWESLRPTKTIVELKMITDRVDKEIAHLTFARQSVVNKEWSFDDIYLGIEEVIKVFTNNVPFQLLGNRWKS